MTVHGAKGLQAPIVILADATGNPETARKEALALPDPGDPDNRAVPLPKLKGEEEVGPIAGLRAQATLEGAQEHWRLLYVAMTRAEEALFVGGALSSRSKGVVPKSSWYALLQEAMGEREVSANASVGRQHGMGRCADIRSPRCRARRTAAARSAPPLAHPRAGRRTASAAPARALVAGRG